jgi:hypothetical protein
MYYDKKIYSLSHFEVSKKKNKKYNAVLVNKKNNNVVHVPFGDKRYEQYFDAVLGYYSKKNHLDPERRRLYRIRHDKDLKKGYYSPGFFSYFYLW